MSETVETHQAEVEVAARAISASLNREPRFQGDPVDYMSCERAADAALDRAQLEIRVAACGRCTTELARVQAERDAYKAALAELVRLKDHPQHDELTDEKRAAWEAARSVLAGVVSTREKDK